MTAIVGIADKTGVYIGGDSAGVNRSLDITERADEKVFQNGSFIIGCTTSFRMIQLLRYRFSPPKQKDKQDDMEYMVVDFIDAVRNCFADGGFGKAAGKENNSGGQFLVGYNGKLYSIESDFQVGITARQYDAVGCGSSYALGSLKETIGQKAEVRIEKALEAAALFSAGVIAPFVIMADPVTTSKNKKAVKK